MLVDKPKRVVYFSRKPRYLGNFSIESYFLQIKENLSNEFKAEFCFMPFYNNGIFKRFLNAVYCYFKQGDINHVTGDIHYVSIFLSKKKTILTIHDCGMLVDLKGLKLKISKLFWFELPIRRVKYVTVVSKSTQMDLLNNFIIDVEKVIIIHVCIPKFFKKVIKPFNENEPRILQLGTAPNKNLATLIPALNGINCKLVIVGKINEEMKGFLKDNKVKFELMDWRLTDEEIFQEYIKADMLAMVSTLEGFGMPIIEANTVGRCVLAGNNSSMPEVANNAALLVDSDNVEAIRNGILRIIKEEELRNELIQNGFLNAFRFNPKTLAEEYMQVYRKIG